MKVIKQAILKNARTKDKIEAERALTKDKIEAERALEKMQKKEFVDNTCKEFLKELAKLSRKHGVYIGGCGCCGSPYLYKKDGACFARNLEYAKNRYSVEEQREDEERIREESKEAFEQDEIMTILEEAEFNETDVIEND